MVPDVNKILKKYGYTLIMDKIHDDGELKKYEKIEKYFDRKTYLTIKDKKNIVIGRVYNINSSNGTDLAKRELTEKELDIILAFFKFFRIPNAGKVAGEISKLFKIDIKGINVDIIRNNIYKQNVY